MSVIRQGNWIGEQRIDLPHLRALESSICGDFDVFAGMIVSGTKPLVVQGFDIINAAAAVGQKASSLQLNGAQGLMMNYYASQSGSIFYSTNVIVNLNETDSRFQGSFTASAVNYVGIDLIRTANNNTTIDTIKVLNIDTLQETSRQVPLSNLLDFKVIVTTQDFDSIPSLCPICKITTDSLNNITAIEDCRYTPFRLAQGGSFPDIQNSYGWPQGRDENTTGDVFYGGDKAITSYKDWADAIMTRLWELGGGKYWYSPTADRNVRMTRSGTTFSNNEWFEWDGTNLHWRGLSMVFDNSGTTIWYNIITDQLTDASGAYGTTATNLVNGDCIYVDIDRTSNATLVAIKGQISQLGWPVTPGSRVMLAWCINGTIFTRDAANPVGISYPVATTSVLGIVKLHNASLSPSAPVVLSDGDLNTAGGVVGFNSNLEVSWTSTSGDGLSVTSGVHSTAIKAIGDSSSSSNGLIAYSGGSGRAIIAYGSGSGAAISAISAPSTTGSGVVASAGGYGGYALQAVSAYNGGVGWSADWLGLPTARLLTWNTDWNTNNSLPDGWTSVLHGAGGGNEVSVEQGSSLLGDANIVQLTLTNAALGDFVELNRTLPISQATATNQYVFSFDAVPGIINSDYSFIGGLVDIPASGSTPLSVSALNYIYILVDTGIGPNFFFKAKQGSSITTVDTGVAVASSIFKIRIEYIGSTLNGTSYPIANLYINQSLVATISNANVPVNMFLCPAWDLETLSATSSTRQWSIGWTQFAGSLG